MIKRTENGKRRKMWYPEIGLECCHRRECLYYSSYTVNNCDYCILTEHCKITGDDYKRKFPPGAGCSCYKKATPAEQKALRIQQSRKAQTQNLQLLKRLRNEFPWLYADIDRDSF